MSDAPSPIEQIFGTFTAFHRSAALKAAVELDLFTIILAGATAPDAIAAKAGAAARGVRILTSSHLTC